MPRHPSGLDRRLAHVERPTGLIRTLGVPTLVGIGLASVVGSGIFVLSGQAAARFAGPAIIISFLIAALIATLPALCFSELSTTMPVSGGAFAYTFTVFGPLIGWIVAWALLVEYLVGAAVMAIGWASYAENIAQEFGAEIPGAIAQGPFADDPGVMNLPAAILVGLAALLLLQGASESARANAILVAIKLGALLLFVVMGATALTVDNWDPFFPPSEGFGEFGVTGVLRAVGVVFLTYISFDVIATAAQEAKNPGRSLPTAMGATLALAALVYVAVALVMTGLVSYTALDVPDPLSIALGAHPDLDWLRNLANAAAVAGLAAGVVSLLYGQSRILMRMAREGLMPRAIGRVDTRTESPRTAILACAAAGVLIAAFGSYNVLAITISGGTIVAYGIVCASVLRLRKLRPDLERPFRVPFGPVVPIAGIVALACVFFLLPPRTLLIVASWIAIGLVVWFLYTRHEYRRAVEEQRAVAEGGQSG